MTFILDAWYVVAWDFELESGKPIGRSVVGEPIALYRRGDGTVVVFEDRCPHRHAPLSLGRVEGDDLRCMYHGLKFGPDGVCKSVPGTAAIPRKTHARVFPAVEKWNWVWVWPGDPALADPGLVPECHGLDDPRWTMRASALDYAADHQLIHDNLCDLSHLDFVHETTLGAATGSRWSDSSPVVTQIDHGLRIERWFRDQATPNPAQRVDTWNSYRFVLPGLFIMTTRIFPAGAAAAAHGQAPSGDPIMSRVEQQAVTPIGHHRSRYFYATGMDAGRATAEVMEQRFEVINAAFAEDKRMIEAQQRIWDLTPGDRSPGFIPQDKAPAMFRRLLARKLAAEQAAPGRTTQPAVGSAGR